MSAAPRLSLLHARHASNVHPPHSSQSQQPVASSAYLPALLSFFSLYVPEVSVDVLSAHSLNSGSSLTLPSLTDGSVLSHVLHYLSPAFFTALPASSLSDHSSVLTSLLTSIEAALEDHAGHAVDLSPLRPTSSMASLDGRLYPLLSASLLCCVYSEAKEAVVDDIMTLGEDKQLALMAVISEWEERLDTGVDATDEGDDAEEAENADGSPRASPTTLHSVGRRNGEDELDELKASVATARGSINGVQLENGNRGDGSGAVSMQQYAELKERLHSELRERDKELAALRQLMSQQAAHSKAHEEQLAADVDSRVRERTLDLERQLAELRRADTTKQLRDKDERLQSLQQQLAASTVAQLTLQRERDRLSSQLQQREESMREQTEQLSVLQQRLEEYMALKEKLARMQQRLEVVSDLKEQYAMVEEEAREKGERLAELEDELAGLRELRSREREWREEKREKERELVEVRVKSERWEEEVEECRGELRQLRDEQRRWKEEQREWQDRGVQQRTASGSIESMGGIAEEYRSRASFSQPVHTLAVPAASPSSTASIASSAASVAHFEDELRERDSQLQSAERRCAELARSVADWERNERRWRDERETWQAERSRLDTRIQKGESVLVRLKARWDEERQSVRVMRARVREYESILRELDAIRAEEELMAVRERLVMSTVLCGVGAEVQRLGLIHSLQPADDARLSGG